MKHFKNQLITVFFSFFALSSVNGQIQYGGTPKLLNIDNFVTTSIKTFVMPSFNLDSVQHEDAVNDKLKAAYRFGFNHFVNIDLISNATTFSTDSGNFYFTKIKSDAALSLNFSFNKFVLPKKVSVFIVGANKTFIGALTHMNQQADSMLATDVLFTEEATFEVFIPASVNKNDVKLNLFRVTHGYRDFLASTTKSIGESGSCNTNINCVEGDDWQKEKRAIACVVVNGNEICTGTLINNTANDGTPYFLTAYHCGVTNVGLWIFRFNYESKSCINTPLMPSQSISGAQLIATSTNSDFTLLKLNTPPPPSYNVYYAGWDRSLIAPSSCVSIHHPNGDIKKISFAGQAQAGTYATALCWKTGLWVKGNTEPGSSGAPLFNQNKKIVGQLYGGPSGCNSISTERYDFFGRFDQSWNYSSSNDAQLKYWLDPLNKDTASIGGFIPSGIHSLTASIERLRGIDDNEIICNNKLALYFFLTNEGNIAITSSEIKFFVDDVLIDSILFTGNLKRYDSEKIALPLINNLNNGKHKIKVEITKINNVSNFEFTESCKIEKQFLVSLVENTISVPYLETFYNTDENGWNVSSQNIFLNWKHNVAIGAYGDNTGCFYADNYSSIQNIMGKSTYLFSPIFNFSNANSDILLSFDIAYAPKNTARKDSLLVYLSDNCGETFKPIYKADYTELATAPATSNFFVPKINEWKSLSVNLNEYANASNVQLLFENKSGWGNVLYLDNMRIDALLGTKKNDNEKNVYLYPNPASNEFCISINKKIIQIVVKNQLEQVVLSTNAVSNNCVKTSSLPNGIYFVEIKTEKEVFIKKIILQKNE